VFNPLPVQFKSLLPGKEGCVFFSGYLNICTCQYTLVRLGRQAAFKSSTLEYVRSGKGLNNTLKIRVGILYLPTVHKNHDDVELQILMYEQKLGIPTIISVS
jgi:hypothetical protein